MSKEKRKRLTERIPLLPLRGLSVFPNTVITIDIARDRSLAAVRSAAQGEDQRLFVVAQRDTLMDHPGLEELYTMGTVAMVKQVLHMPDGTARVLLEGHGRGMLLNIWLLNVKHIICHLVRHIIGTD